MFHRASVLLQSLASRFCGHDEGGLTEDELNQAVVELKDYADLGYREIALCLPVSRDSAEQIYQNHPKSELNGGFGSDD